MLDYDAETRVKPYDALQHVFFRRDSTTSSVASIPGQTDTLVPRGPPEVALPVQESLSNGLPDKGGLHPHMFHRHPMVTHADSIACEISPQIHLPTSQFNSDLFPGGTHPLHQQSFPHVQPLIQDPMMGRTNIPMPLPPGPYPAMDGSSVTLTPLSPPQSTPDGRHPPLEVPYAHHSSSYSRPYPHNLGVGLTPVLSTGKPYSQSYPYTTQNGTVPQTFFGTNHLFSDSSGEPFHFKFASPSGAHLNTTNPFSYHSSQPSNGVDRSPSLRTKSDRKQRNSHQLSTNQTSGGESHDSPMVGVVVQQ